MTAVPDLPADALGLARVVSRQVRESGKHVLPPSLLHAMVLLRGRPDRFVVAFLDCLLDKHDGRFHNRTYLALGLLELILADPRGVPDRERLSALLMADVIRHETAVAATPPRADDYRPDARTLGARLAHARRFVAECGVPEGAAALREGDVRSAREQVERAVAAFAKAALLFRVVATMRAAAFHRFREFTQGASAIQSEAYKRFEIACGRPSTERLCSDAFGNVAAVRAEALAGADDLSSAYLAARPQPHLDGPEWERFDAAVVELEHRHQRWKTTHFRLAARMLGDAAGSGYTAGVPYLRQCLENRLFWRIPLAA